MTQRTETIPESGAVIDVPLARSKVSISPLLSK